MIIRLTTPSGILPPRLPFFVSDPAESRVATQVQEIGLKVKLVERMLDSIQHHAPRTSGEKYGGTVPPEVMLPEIVKH
jgi:hypothetical protein